MFAPAVVHAGVAEQEIEAEVAGIGIAAGESRWRATRAGNGLAVPAVAIDSIAQCLLQLSVALVVQTVDVPGKASRLCLSSGIAAQFWHGGLYWNRRVRQHNGRRMTI